MVTRTSLLWIALALGSGCATPPAPTSGRYDTADAVVAVATGLAASGISRANGDCYAACPSGTTCRGEDGLCVPLPCRGTCREGETCDEATLACVKDGPPADLGVRRTQRPVEERDYWDRAKAK